MLNFKIFIIKDRQLDSLNEYLNAVVINSSELRNIHDSIVIVSYNFYKNKLNSIPSNNTVVVSADNDAVLLSGSISDNVYQIIDGTPLHNNEFYFSVASEFMSLLDVIEQAQKLNISNRTNTYFTLNGRNDAHRSLLVKELFNSKCINNGLVIYHNPTDLAGYVVDSLSKPLYKDQFVKNFIQPELNNVWHDGYADSAYYSNYNLEIITETTVLSHFITEKTIRPLSARMPFLVISSPGYLAHLRQLGFKTFGDIWDESYDNIKNTSERVKAVVAILDKLIRTKQIYNLTNECNAILNHNALHVHTIARNHKTSKSKRLSKFPSMMHQYITTKTTNE